MSINNDPDGLGCYSDHAHDIKIKGACDMCTSTDPNVIGHVLPDTERLTGIDPVEASEIVVSSQSFKIVDGVLLDYFSATHVLAVYQALSTPEAKAKLRAMSLTKAVTVCFKVTQRAQS